MKKLLLLSSVLILALSGCATDGVGSTEPTVTTSPPPAAKPASTESITVTCPQQCKIMRCPPPYGTYKVCCPVAPYNQTCP